MSCLAFLGRLSLDTIITAAGRVYERIPGGGMLYAAAAASTWSREVRLIGRYDEAQYKLALDQLEEDGFRTVWLSKRAEALPHEAFFAYEDPFVRRDGNPARYFLRAGLPLPKRYLRSDVDASSRPDREILDPRVEDLPAFDEVPEAVHFASVGWRQATLLSAELAERGVPLITCDPSSADMATSDKSRLQLLLSEMRVFLPSERQVQDIFRPVRLTVPELAEALAEMGPEVVVIKRGRRGMHLYEASARTHWQIPAYPARVVDITGAGHALCGGFLAGLADYSEPLMAALCGSVSASLAIEGTGYNHACLAHPQLKQARLSALRERSRKI